MSKDAIIFMNSRRTRNIKRCNNFPCLMSEDVAQHSYFVTMLCNIFAEEYNDWCMNSDNIGFMVDKAEILEKALCHDWDEAFISDIPYVVKHITPEVNRQLGDALDGRMRGVLDGCSMAIKKVYETCVNCKTGFAGTIVSICDMLELAIYCYEECKMGNISVEPILKNCVYYLRNMEHSLSVTVCKTETLPLVLSEVTPTINSIWKMVDEYKFSINNPFIDIESHGQL